MEQLFVRFFGITLSLIEEYQEDGRKRERERERIVFGVMMMHDGSICCSDCPHYPHRERLTELLWVSFIH